MNDADCAIVCPCAELHGTLRVPGDKSISHRTAMLAALARGESRISGFLMSGDCLNTLKAIEALGCRVAITPSAVLVAGGEWVAPKRPLDLGNSGTGMRLLAGLLAGRPWVTELTGDASLCSRPMRRIQQPLELMGARIELSGPKGCAPMRVHGGVLRGIEYAMPVASAQVKSAVMLAALFAEGETAIREPAPTRDHTELVFKTLGLPLRIADGWIRLPGFGAAGPVLAPRAWEVPGDFSSSAFWLVAAAALPGSLVTIREVGLNPRRAALLDVLRRMGAEIVVQYDTKRHDCEPSGTVTVKGGVLHGTEIGGAEIPNLIDELPVLAVAGALAQGTTLIRDAAELRVKESDRIACMAADLRELGVNLDEREDGMRIKGGRPVRGGTVNSYGDHRVAMAMAVLALHAAGAVRIINTACVQTSYPEFWQHLEALGAHVELSCSN